jgi:polyhydroxyalkanoate synthesis regulator phasin
MAGRRTPQQQVQDALRDAVERTVHAGQQTAGKVRQQLEASRPATHEELAALRKELRALAKRLDKLETRPSKKKAK